jgi:hypothetical protein
VETPPITKAPGEGVIGQTDGGMAAPRFAPVTPTEQVRYYSSPDHVPAAWEPDRPGELEGPQPRGERLGTPGPDQGFALKIANRLAPKVRLQQGEQLDDAVRGCLAVALKRASLFSRAPVVHDLTIAFTIWGFYDDAPPAELVQVRRSLFEGVGNSVHHYAEGRMIADRVPESTLRATPDEVARRYPAEWRALTGA